MKEQWAAYSFIQQNEGTSQDMVTDSGFVKFEESVSDLMHPLGKQK